MALILALFVFVLPYNSIFVGDTSNPAIPKITGFVSTDLAVQALDIEIDKSQVYTLRSDSVDPIHLSTFRLSGSVIGDGMVQIFLDDGEKELLIYSNVKKREGGMALITGMATGAGGAPADQVGLVLEPGNSIDDVPVKQLTETEELTSGSFENECAETCFVSIELSNTKSSQLIFKVEPGTILKINEIVYTLIN